MKTNLIVTDPLAGQDVSIIVTLAAGEAGAAGLPRDKRPSLLSVGVAGQMPIIRSGTFGELSALIHEAWTAFGVREQVNREVGETAVLEKTAVSTQLKTAVSEELIAEATVPATDNDQPPPASIICRCRPLCLSGWGWRIGSWRLRNGRFDQAQHKLRPIPFSFTTPLAPMFSRAAVSVLVTPLSPLAHPRQSKPHCDYLWKAARSTQIYVPTNAIRIKMIFAICGKS